MEIDIGIEVEKPSEASFPSQKLKEFFEGNNNELKNMKLPPWSGYNSLMFAEREEAGKPIIIIIIIKFTECRRIRPLFARY